MVTTRELKSRHGSDFSNDTSAVERSVSGCRSPASSFRERIGKLVEGIFVDSVDVVAVATRDESI